ncbi:MAG: hypothetical protein V4615_13835 [Bacteroidota bacterium]
MKKTLLLFSAFLFAGNILFAQEDDLPPPSSNPQKEETQKGEQKPPPDPNDFQGFKRKKKFDFSNFIIEPNINFLLARGTIDVGLSPYVGYKVFEPQKSKVKGSNTGLFVGGGVIYRFAQVSVQTDPSFGQIYYGKGKFHTYGGGVFLQYNVWKSFFVRTKFELVHRSGDDLFQGTVLITPRNNGGYEMTFPKLSKTVPALLVGAGFNLLRRKNFFMPVMLSYDVLHSVVDKNYSLYPRGVALQLAFITLF